MIVFRLAAAAAGMGALFATALGTAHNHPPAPPVMNVSLGAPPQVASVSEPPSASPAIVATPTPVPAVAPTPVATAAPPPVAAITPAFGPLVERPSADASTPLGTLTPLAERPPAEAATPAPAPAAQPALAPLSAPDAGRVAAAAALYRKGDEAGGDAVARTIADPIERLALDWAALRLAPHPDMRRLAAFAAAHANWPGDDWIRAEQEADLYTQRAAPDVVAAAFAHEPPRTPAGKLAVARAALAAGRRDEAYGIVRALWRESDLDLWTESAVLKDFASALTRDDHKYRADRLLYAEKPAAALRAAALAGADEMALAGARIAAMRGPLTTRAVAAVPAALQNDPGLIFARVQDARRANRALEAASWLGRAPADAKALIDPDKWWSERRMVARELLDLGEIKKAFDVCAAAHPTSIPAQVDADFHAGWIALRFLHDAPEAARRFAAASTVAQTPLSVARAAYWQGRAAEAMDQYEAARGFYESAARWPIAYYGQLAAQRLGRETTALRAPADVATGAARDEATRVVEVLYAAGLDDLATSLAEAAGGHWSDEAQLAALAQVVARHGDATIEVGFGKLVTERGFALDAAAFPTTGLPTFAPLAHSADLAAVYAVARQESEFAWRAASGAGAKGLMQILPGTAQSTARRAGVAYDAARLTHDPAYNTQLGAAFLGQLMDDEQGSLELTLAAYNAGAGRVAQWIAAYGDPRSGKVDPVDWVERIPFDETRDYVERVSENLSVYRARLAAAPVATAKAAIARE